MPGPTRPDGFFKAQVIYTTNRRTCVADLYYSADAPPSSQWHIQAMANAVCAKVRTQWAACLANGCTFQGVFLVYSNTETDVLFEAMSSQSPIVNTGVLPEAAMATLPDETVAVIRKLTGLGGREDRGRIFISGCPETFNDEGFVNEDGRTALRALGAKIPEDVHVTAEPPEGEPGEPADLSTYMHARHWNRKDNQMRPIIGHLVNSIFMSRRDRRKPLIGFPVAGAVAP